MLKEKYMMPMLYFKLKEGVSLPIDGTDVSYNEGFNFSNDTHVLNNIEYSAMYYGLRDLSNNEDIDIECDYEVLPQDADLSKYLKVNGFNGDCLNILTLNNEAIAGYSLVGDLEGDLLALYGSDDRHGDGDGTTVDIFVNSNIISKYFDVYSYSE